MFLASDFCSSSSAGVHFAPAVREENPAAMQVEKIVKDGGSGLPDDAEWRYAKDSKGRAVREVLCYPFIMKKRIAE